MIVAVCSDGGSPGVTTLALLLSLHWQATVLEADPSGGDLRFRLHPAGSRQDFLDDRPGLIDLAAASRAGGVPASASVAGLMSGVPLPGPVRSGLPGGVRAYAQQSSLGVSVVSAPTQAEEFLPMVGLWPAIAGQLALAPDLVVADLGRLQPGHAAWSLAQSAEVVIVLAWPTVEGLHHLRERVTQLSGALGEGHERTPVAAAVLAYPGGGDPSQDVRAVLGARGLPVTTVGAVAMDVHAADRLRDGELTGRLRRSSLWKSTAEIGENVMTGWPSVASRVARGELLQPLGGALGRQAIGARLRGGRGDG